MKPFTSKWGGMDDTFMLPTHIELKKPITRWVIYKAKKMED
jgi:hypothetical protein